MGVWLLLLVTLVMVGGCVAACGFWVMRSVNPTMHPFTSAEGKFRVEFPNDPTPKVVTGEKGNGSVTVTGQRDEHDPQERYVVKVYSRPLRLRFLPDEDALEELVKAELAERKVGTEISRQMTQHDGHPALDVMTESNPGLFNRRVSVMRLILSGNKVYVVLAQDLAMDAKTWWVRRFFVSFELIDPAKPRAKPPEEKDKPNGPEDKSDSP
jgi:hypothetical protein